MKRIIALALTVVLAVCGTISGYAWSNNVADFEEAYDGAQINSSELSSEVLDIRNTWTVSRNGSNNATSTNTSTWNTSSVVENDGTNGYAKFVAPQWVNCDQTYTEKSALSVKLKKSTTNGFTGFVFNYGQDYTTSLQELNTQNDYFYKEFEAVSSDMNYVMATGFGFTFLKNSNSKVRFFVRTLNGTNFDVISYDYDTGVDLTQEFHTYQMSSYKLGTAKFLIDGSVVATVTYDNEVQLSAVTTSYRTLDCAYYRNAKIMNNAGTVVASTSNALVSADNTINFACVGTGSVVYMDNLACKTLSKVSCDFNDDGEKSAEDCVRLLKYINSMNNYSINGLNADLDNDGYINSLDVLLLLKNILNPQDYPIEDYSDITDDEEEDNEGYFEIGYKTNSYVNIGDSIELTATYNLHSGGTLGCTFKSLTKAIATSDEEGVVTGVSEGTATIRCTAENGRYVDFYVTVLSDTISAELMTAVKANNSNVFTRYDLGIGAGTPAYYRNIIGSISNIQYNDELVIDETYLNVGNSTAHSDGYKSTYGFKNEFITVHYTGNMSVNATAKNNASYFAYTTSVSIHYVTGNDGVYHCMDDGKIAWHAGDRATGQGTTWNATGVYAPTSGDQTPTWSISSNGKFMINGQETTVSVPSRSKIYVNGGIKSDSIAITGPTFVYNGVTYPCITEMGLPWKVVDGQYYMGNTWWCATQKVGGRICGQGGDYNSIGIESCVNPETDLWYTWHKTAQLVAKLMRDNGLGIERVTGHNMWTSKNCPQPFLENDLEIWDEFIDMCEAEYDKLVNSSGYTYSMKIVKGFDLTYDTDQTATLDYNGTIYNYTLAPGRVIPGEKAKVVLYEVTVTNGASVETIQLASAVNSIYSK